MKYSPDKRKIQFSIELNVRNALDEYGVANKDKIIKALHLKRRFVSNSHVMAYLLMRDEARK